MVEVSDAEPRGAGSAGRARLADAVPGLWSAIVVALLSGLGCWFWALPQLARGGQPASAGGTSELAEVAAAEIPAALGTMNGSNGFMAQWQQSNRSCGQRLAWVTVSRQAGEPPGTFRLKSGSYFSPIFALPDSPMRIAIPYPAPYATGRGSLTVLATGGKPVVALTPAWPVAQKDTQTTRPVSWRIGEGCVRGNG